MTGKTSGRFVLLWFGLFAALAGIGLFYGEASRAQSRPQTEPPPPPPGVVLPEAVNLRTAAPETADHAEATAKGLLLPDGSTVPALNGVLVPAPMRWKKGRPYSPIIGQRTRAGVDWYEHADNSFTTTVMAYREDLGREDAMTVVSHPVPEPKNLHR